MFCFGGFSALPNWGMLQVQAMVGCVESLGPQFPCGFFIGAPKSLKIRFCEPNVSISSLYIYFEIEHVGFSKRGRVRSERNYECLSFISSKNANIWRCEEVSGTHCSKGFPLYRIFFYRTSVVPHILRWDLSCTAHFSIGFQLYRTFFYRISVVPHIFL